MNQSQQRKLGRLLRSIYENRIIENPAPIKREIICPKCGERKSFIGKKKWHSYNKKTKKLN